MSGTVLATGIALVVFLVFAALLFLGVVPTIHHALEVIPR